MIAKIALLFAALAAAEATILAPGLLSTGIVAPAAVSTGSIVSIPGAVTTDKRIIGTTGLIGGSPLLLNNAGLVGNGLLANGLIGAAPIPIARGLISPIGLSNAGILAAPGIGKIIL